ncbi:MAG TPA: TonB-dependent receptor [Candidatus Binatia bacterium]|nr:TonB-dependent receptor [Candidatus Binatia bacterium]
MNLLSKFTTSRTKTATQIWLQKRIGLSLFALFFAASSIAAAQGLSPSLKQLTLEQLMDLEITSVTKKEQKVSDTAAAIYVITQEEIRRSGVTTVAEALRLAPGVTVSRLDGNSWAVGIRGFASAFSRAVLVLVDGRSVYTPLFAGVYWEVQDTLLEDIERIEVIRGPGGTIWGANAVNGVINIITKNAADTQGLLLTGGGGSEEKGFGGLRYGGKIGENFTYRLYGKGFRRDGQFTPRLRDVDDWQTGQGGFRADWNVGQRDKLTFQGDLYEGRAGMRDLVSRFTAAPFSRIVEEDVVLSGANLLGRWTRHLATASDLALQIYYDTTYRREPRFHERRNTFDLDFQHRFNLSGRHDLIWGLGYRYTRGDTDSVPTLVISPENRTDHLFSAFLQDEIMLVRDRLRLTIGSKFEHNDYTGFEAQPSIRLLWTPTDDQSVWAAISRAVRTPSRIDSDVAASSAPDPTLPFFGRLLGNKDFESEKTITYELGYRIQPTGRLYLDIAGFYSRYDDLFSVEARAPFLEPGPRLIIPFQFDNKFKGEGYGVEIAGDWRWLDWWRWRLAYTYLQLHLTKKRGSTDTVTEAPTEGGSPHNQVSLTTFMNLPGNLELDGIFRYIDNLPGQNIGRYFNLDVRLGWHVIKNVDLSVVGQNLLAGHHAEGASGTQVQRGIYTKATWRW